MSDNSDDATAAFGIALGVLLMSPFWCIVLVAVAWARGWVG